MEAPKADLTIFDMMEEPRYIPKLVVVLLILSTLVLSVGCGTRMDHEVSMAYDELPSVIDYNIDIKPILSDRCYHCHGLTLISAKRAFGLIPKKDCLLRMN